MLECNVRANLSDFGSQTSGVIEICNDPGGYLLGPRRSKAVATGRLSDCHRAAGDGVVEAGEASRL